MTDVADLAAAFEAGHLATALARIDAVIPAGVAGECEECGEQMPRLVGGRCGFCRDGRRPPLSRFDDPPAEPSRPRKEHFAMTNPNTSDSQTISVPAKGELLASIRRRAEESGKPLGQAVLSLVSDALARAEARESTAAPELATISLDDLLGELRVRVAQSDLRQALVAMERRATDAEARLEAIRAQVLGS